MNESVSGFAAFGVAIGATVCGFKGLYLAYHESFTSLIITLAIPPWAVIKGLISFFA